VTRIISPVRYFESDDARYTAVGDIIVRWPTALKRIAPPPTSEIALGKTRCVQALRFNHARINRVHANLGAAPTPSPAQL